MTVNTPDPLYRKYAPKWRRVRDCLEGRDAVLDGGDEYLPKLSGQDIEEYEAYAMRGNFYEATSRTREALTGLVFSRPADVKLSAQVDALSSNIDAAGTDLNTFAGHLVDEALTTGRGLIVVNHSGDPTKALTADQAAKVGRAYLRFYAAEAIIAWRVAVIDGVTQLSRVVLRELTREQDPQDENLTIDVERFRVLDITKDGYRQRLYQLRPKTNASEADVFDQVGDDVYPVLNGERWRVLPVALVSLDKAGGVDPGHVPLLALSDLNLSHWRTAVDLEHGAHFTGLPTPWVVGHTLGEQETIKIGSAEALVFSDPNVKVGFLEFGGQGLGTLERLLTRKEQHMAALGARLLAPEKAQAESGDALQIRRTGETSALARVASAVSAALTRALQYMDVWLGADPSSTFDLNKQYAADGLNAQEMAELLKAWQSGAISFDTFYFNLQRGGRARDGVTAADEQETIRGEDMTPSDPQNDNVDPNTDPQSESPARAGGN